MKDRSTEKKLEMDQLKETRKEAISRKDAIEKGGSIVVNDKTLFKALPTFILSTFTRVMKQAICKPY